MEGGGYRTLAVPDGQAAWEILEQHADAVALVLTDIEMPRLDGLELTRRIRANEPTAALPVVMLTSLAGEEDVDRGRAAGATAYCIKLDRDQLLATVRELLAGGPRMEALEEGASGLKELSQRLCAEAEPAGTGLANQGETR